MSEIAGMMPEAKYRSTKKRVQPAYSSQSPDPAHQLHLVKPAQPAGEPAKPKAEPKSAGLSIASFWPVAVGLLLAGFAPEWHAMAAQAGIWAMRFAFPLSLIATHREIGFGAMMNEQMAAHLPQIALYAQLPLDGLLTMLTLLRKRSLKSAIAQLILLHATCAFVLWLITFSSN